MIFREKIRKSFIDEFLQYFGEAWKDGDRSIVGEGMTITVFEDGSYFRYLQIRRNGAS